MLPTNCQPRSIINIDSHHISLYNKSNDDCFFEVETWERELLQQALAAHALVFSEHKLTQETLGIAKEADIVSTFIYSQLSSDILSQLPHLTLIATRSTGYDYIDLSYCRQHNITVCNIPAYGVNTIAEHTFALILALSRKIIPAVEKHERVILH